MATERDVIEERLNETLRALVAAIGALNDTIEAASEALARSKPPSSRPRGGR